MVKYWDSRRIQKVRERQARREELAAKKAAAMVERERSYTPGDTKKNTGLMLDALGLAVRRKMVDRLRKGGAMSLSKLADPFHITLPAALEHLRMLERCGIVITHKHGRVRMCVYNPRSLKELADWLRG